MLSIVDIPVVGGENSSCGFYSTPLPCTEIHAEASNVTIDKATPSGSHALDLPDRQTHDAFPRSIKTDQTGRHVTRTGPCFEVRKAATANARRLAIAKAIRHSPKRTRRCTVSDAQKHSPRMQPSLPRVPCRSLNKENMDPKLLPSRSSPLGMLSSSGVARAQGAQSITLPLRRKRLLSDASSSFNSSRQCPKLSDKSENRDGGNNFKIKKRWDNSREPLRVLWTREGNSSTAPPLFLRGLRSL